jgi:type VI secretion system protein ImpD
MASPAFRAGDTLDRDEAQGLSFAALAAHIDRLIVAIDGALARQLNAILHAPSFAALEGRWRALAMLVLQAEDGVVIRILDASWPVLSRHLERVADHDQSHLFRLIYDEEFGMPGGTPFGLMIGDYEVDARPEQGGGDPVETLRKLAAVGAAAFCPVILGAAPALLGLKDFAELRADTDLAPPRGTEQADLAALRWNGLRDGEDCRFLGLVAPRVAIRGRMRRFQGRRADGFCFDEAAGHLSLVNGAFAFAAMVMQVYQDTGWFAAIRGAYQDAPGGGRVSALRPYDFGTDRHRLSAQAPVELRLTAAQEEALIERGLIPLCALHLMPEAVFGASPSLHRPQRYASPVATQNARLAALLQYVLCTSRFAHYLKVIMRDEIGSVADPALIEAQLTDWLRGYCLGNDDADQMLKAQYPLRDAGVEVQPIAGRPGTYACTVRLQPHFQLDDISTSFHLIAEAPGQPLAERVSA